MRHPALWLILIVLVAAIAWVVCCWFLGAHVADVVALCVVVGLALVNAGR